MIPYPSCIKWLLCGSLLLVSPQLIAAEINYRVDIQAPRHFRSLLKEQLELAKRQGARLVDEDRLQKMYRETPDRIRELMATEGYFSPRIDVTLIDGDQARVVNIRVEPGQQTLVRKLNLSFSGEITQPEAFNLGRIGEMRQGWHLRPGEPFTQEAWERSKRALLHSFLSDRYPGARIIASEATISPEAYSADLDVSADSGPAYVFGELKVEGLKRYPSSIISNLNPIEVGDAYDQSKIYELQRRVQTSGYFANVFVSAPLETDPIAKAPLIVSVVEKPAKSVSFGVGVSTNTGGRLQAKYVDNNVRDAGWKWRNELKLENKQQLLATELALPTGRDGWQAAAHTSLSRTNIEGEVSRKFELGLKRQKIEEDIERTLAVLYSNERRDIAGAPSDHAKALTANYIWTKRAVDDVLYPHRGYLLQLELGGAARPLLSDTTFLRSYGKTAYFRPLSKRETLILSGELGVVLAKHRRGIPSQFLFRTGGDQSVRGYSYLSIGVREGDAVVGGRYLGVGSVEYERYFNDKWGGALFYDAGVATDQLSNLKISQGVGVGARWRSPVGPLKLDLAYGLRSQQVRLHFSVGFAF